VIKCTSVIFKLQLLLEIHAWIVTAQCTLVQMRGLGIACRPSVRPSVRLSVTLVICRGVYSIEAWTQPASLKKQGGNENHAYFGENWGGRKIKGGRKTKLLKHMFALFSSYFLKNFLARFARSITFYFHPPIRGRGSYTAGTVKSVSLLKVGIMSRTR